MEKRIRRWVDNENYHYLQPSLSWKIESKVTFVIASSILLVISISRLVTAVWSLRSTVLVLNCSCVFKDMYWGFQCYLSSDGQMILKLVWLLWISLFQDFCLVWFQMKRTRFKRLCCFTKVHSVWMFESFAAKWYVQVILTLVEL